MQNELASKSESSDNNRSQMIERLIRQYADMIYRIALQNTGNTYDAEDILQEVSTALVTGDAPLDDPVHLKRWLIRVTINKCRDLYRRNKRIKTEPLENHLDMPAEEKPSVIEELSRLSELHRNILYLYYYENYNIREISEILRKNINTVRSGLQRGRKYLKKILTEEENHHEK